MFAISNGQRRNGVDIMLALNTTDMLKKLTKSECLETSYRAYKYSTSEQWKRRRRRRRSSWRTTSNLNDCNNNNHNNKSNSDLSERKPKAVKQIIPWKSVKEKNPHDTSDCLRLRKFSWFRDLCFQLEEKRGRGRGRGYALSFAQDKFNERTPATDLSDTLHCRPASPSDKLQSSTRQSSRFRLAKFQTILYVSAGQVCVLSLSL